MKVQLTAQNKMHYDALFREMVKYCKEDLKMDAVPEEITSLGTYYAWLDKVRGNEHYDLFRLPVEQVEGYFDIDLDSRKIKIPGKDEAIGRGNSFSENGLGVQGDHAAEIIYFRCARYFDTMDLSLCKVNDSNIQGAIWIQWKRKGDTLPHLSLAYNVDLHHTKEVTASGEEVDKEELIFGWILGDEATRFDGDLEFSVRFVQWDITDDENRYIDFDNGEAPRKLCFSLSTQSAKCRVHPSLSSEYEPGQIMIESNLNKLVYSRPIYSGIYETAFGAYPVFLSDGNLDSSEDLVENEDGKGGTFTYVIKAYSPDNGTLSIAWYQDIYEDEFAAVRVTDESRLKTSVKDGTYTFELLATQAGSYYAVVSNTPPAQEGEGDKSIRTVTSNGSVIPHASDFVINETQMPILGYAVSDSGTNLVLSVENANGNASGVTQNSLNGVDYQWYIRTANFDGSYNDAAAIPGANQATYAPAAADDGLVYCVITNRRNGHSVSKTSETYVLRPAPVAPQADIVYNSELNRLELQFAEGTDLRDLTYRWQDLDDLTVGSSDAHFAPWIHADDKTREFNVACTVTRSYWNMRDNKSFLKSNFTLPVQQ